MVFEHRSYQGSVRAPPLPIIRDHHSAHSHIAALTKRPPATNHEQLYINNNNNNNINSTPTSNSHHHHHHQHRHHTHSNNNNNSNNNNTYHHHHQSKLINLFKGNRRGQQQENFDTTSEPIAIKGSGNQGRCRAAENLPDSPIDSLLATKQQQQYNCRQPPLSVEEYEKDLRQYAGDLQLVERVFYGGIGSNKLRAILWPYLFGLVKQRGRFIKKSPTLSSSANGSFSKPSSASSSASPSPQPPLSPAAAVNGHQNGHTKNGESLLNGSKNGVACSPTHTNGHTKTGPSESPETNATTTTTTTTTNGGAKAKPSGRTISSKLADDNYIYIEHEDNLRRWRELEKLYRNYEAQWKSIMPEQELRFSVFRERKALIERDVIRSDRTHPFYADNSTNLENFTTLLMTYMMYDFDIGYLQGMSDLAAPILYVYQGDLVKAFWVFVEVMKLFRRNFEYSQKTIPFQLNCLYRLIRLTDPKLAHYLRDNECSNCFFVFRCIVCQFKRELMKGNSADGQHDDDPDDGYTEVLNLWDTIWCVQKRHELLAKSNCVHTYRIANSKHRTAWYSTFDPNQADVPRFELTETEKFVLSLCLSLIRRERNQILLNRLDASEIHQHFINPHLTRDFDHFVDQAYEVYQYLNTDCDLQLLVKGAGKLNNGVTSDLSPLCNDDDANGDCAPETADTYDLLKDYLIISPTSYNIPLTSLNNNLNGSGGGGGGMSKSGGHMSPQQQQPLQLATPQHLRRQQQQQQQQNGGHVSARKRGAASKYSVSQRSWDHFLNV